MFCTESADKKLKENLTLLPDEQIALGLVVKDIQREQNIMSFNSTRIFRRGKVYYEGIVHNSPIIPGGEAILCDFMYINHYGYDLSPEQMEIKFQRTNSLLRKRLENNINDFEAMFYLCQLNAESGRDNEEAVKWGDRYLQAKDKLVAINKFNLSIYFTLFRLHLQLHHREEAKKILTQGRNDIPEDLDLALGVLEFGIYDNDPEIRLEGIKAYLNIFNKISQNPVLTGNRFVYSHSPNGFAFVKYHQTLTHLIEGGKALSGFLKSLQSVHPNVRAGFVNDFQKAIKESGIPIAIEFNQVHQKQDNIVAAEFSQNFFDKEGRA